MNILITSDDPRAIVSLFSDIHTQADAHVRAMRSFRRTVKDAQAYARSPYDYISQPAKWWLAKYAPGRLI